MSIFLTTILVATEGSEDATLAASAAVDVSKGTASELHIVNVGPSTEYSDSEEPLVTDIFELSQEELEEINDELERPLDAQVKQIEAGGGSVERAYLKTGKPDEEIVALAEGIGAGLIVVGSRGLGIWKARMTSARLVYSSTSM